MSQLPHEPAEGGPRFDVVIPCYNYGRFLADAVTSVLTQGVAVRVLILDDCSSDDTAVVGRALAARDPRVTFVRHEVNRGHIATYNEGIDWAEGDYFLLLSADDLLMPGALARAAAAFAAAPEIGMVFGRAIYFEDGLAAADVLAARVTARPWLSLHVRTGAGADVRPAAEIEEASSDVVDVHDAARFFALNRRENVIHTCTAITRTDEQKRLGGYLPSLPHSGDLEMWLRFAANRPVGFVSRFQGGARVHGNNMYRQYDQVRDMVQKVAAISAVIASSGHLLPPAVLADVRQATAEQALRLTTVPLEQGRTEDRLALVAAARDLDPGITRRPAWAAYRAKVAMGPRAWGLLRRLMAARPRLDTGLDTGLTPARSGLGGGLRGGLGG